MTGNPVNPFLKLAWGLLTPVAAMGLLVFAVINYAPLTYNKTYVYPFWGEALGLSIAFSSIVFVPLYFFYSLLTAPGVKIKDVRNLARF